MGLVGVELRRRGPPSRKYPAVVRAVYPKGRKGVSDYLTPSTFPVREWSNFVTRIESCKINTALFVVCRIVPFPSD